MKHFYTVNSVDTLMRPEKVLALLLDLTYSDIEIYFQIVKHYRETGEPVGITDLSKITGKSRSAIERHVNKLHRMGLLERKIALSRYGGYVYMYYPSRRAIEILRERTSRLMQEIEEGIEHLQKLLASKEEEVQTVAST